MYISPICIEINEAAKRAAIDFDTAVAQQVAYQLGVDVNKDELLRALAFDRAQYEKGLADGIRTGTREMWISTKDRLPTKADADDMGRVIAAGRSLPPTACHWQTVAASGDILDWWMPVSRLPLPYEEAEG